MTITLDDLKIMRAERRGKGGGGRMSGVEVVDGVSNNLFADTTTVGQWTGRVDTEKAFAFVDSPSNDVFFGAFLVITKPPANPNISATAFSTEDWFDFESAHKSYIGEYLSRGPYWPGQLYERQLQGQQVIQIWQRVNAAIPKVDSTYCLISDEGLPTETEEFVLVTDVSSIVQDFYDSGTRSEYQRRVVSLTISSPLQHSFRGPPVTQDEPGVFSVAGGESYRNARFRQAIVTDSSRFYGVATLTEAAFAGDYALRLSSIFTQLVPASTTETAGTDLNAATQNPTLIPSAAGTITQTISTDLGAGISLYLGGPVIPGTLAITAGPATLTEARGQLYSGQTVVGTVDTAAGLVTFGASSPDYLGPKTVTYRPAADATAPMVTTSIEITQGTQGKAYVRTLSPIPAVGTVRVSYLSQGQWYELRDQGDGQIVGADSSYGAAQVSSLGTLTITLGALPDVGSRIIIGWGSAAYGLDHSADALPGGAFEIFTTAPIPPGGLALAWTDDEGAKTAADDGAGNLTGDATGAVLYTLKRILFRPARLPTRGTVVAVTLTEPRAAAVETFGELETDVEGNLVLPLAHGNVLPGSVFVGLSYNIPIVNAPPQYSPAPPREGLPNLIMNGTGGGI
jgi:hypothetical protein